MDQADADTSNRGRQSAKAQLGRTPQFVQSPAYTPHSRAHSISSTSPHSIGRLSMQEEVPVYGTSREVLRRSPSIHISRLLRRVRSSLDIGARSDQLTNDPPITISHTASLILLLISSALVAVCAEFLVSTIDDVVSDIPLSKPFIGLIILPIAGNVAEFMTAVTVAFKNKMDLAIGVSVGSAIQISLFITPLVILVGWVLGRDMGLHFGMFQMATMVASVLLVNVVLLGGGKEELFGGRRSVCLLRDHWVGDLFFSLSEKSRGTMVNERDG